MERPSQGPRKDLVIAREGAKVSRVKIQLFAPASILVSSLCLFGPANNPVVAADGKSGVGLKLLAEGFASPTALVPLGDGSGRLLVADQIGIVHLLSKEGANSGQPFFDVKSRLTKLIEGFDERRMERFTWNTARRGARAPRRTGTAPFTCPNSR